MIFRILVLLAASPALVTAGCAPEAPVSESRADPTLPSFAPDLGNPAPEETSSACNRAHWAFDGETEDHLGCGNRLVGPAAFTDEGGGMSGRALSLERTLGPLTVAGGEGTLSSDDLTVAFWFKGGGAQPDGAVVLSRGSLAAPPWTSLRFGFKAGELHLAIGLTDGSTKKIALPGVNDGGWHHVAGTFDWDPSGASGVLTGYVDGVARPSVAVSAPIAWDSSPFTVRGYDAYVPLGTIDLLAVLDFALTPRWIKIAAATLGSFNYAPGPGAHRFVPLSGEADGRHDPSAGRDGGGGLVIELGAGEGEPSWAAGDYALDFTLARASRVSLALDYAFFAQDLGSGGLVGLAIHVDGEFIAWVDGLDGDGSAAQSAPWKRFRTFTFDEVLAAGSHQVSLRASVMHAGAPVASAAVHLDNVVLETRELISFSGPTTIGGPERPELFCEAAIVEMNGVITVVGDGVVDLLHCDIHVDQGGEHQLYSLNTADRARVRLDSVGFRERDGSWYDWILRGAAEVSLRNLDFTGRPWIAAWDHVTLHLDHAQAGISTFDRGVYVYGYRSFVWLEYFLAPRIAPYVLQLPPRGAYFPADEPFTIDLVSHVVAADSTVRLDVSITPGIDLRIHDSADLELGWVFQPVWWALWTAGPFTLNGFSEGYHEHSHWDPGYGQAKLTLDRVHVKRWWPHLWGPFKANIDAASMAEAEAHVDGAVLNISNSVMQRVGAYARAEVNVSRSLIERDVTAKDQSRVNLSEITTGPWWQGCFTWHEASICGCP